MAKKADRRAVQQQQQGQTDIWTNVQCFLALSQPRRKRNAARNALLYLLDVDKASTYWLQGDLVYHIDQEALYYVQNVSVHSIPACACTEPHFTPSRQETDLRRPFSRSRDLQSPAQCCGLTEDMTVRCICGGHITESVSG